MGKLTKLPIMEPLKIGHCLPLRDTHLRLVKDPTKTFRSSSSNSLSSARTSTIAKTASW